MTAPLSRSKFAVTPVRAQANAGRAKEHRETTRVDQTAKRPAAE